MTVRTRFAPSPTGFLHIGGARTALFSWAFARHYEGAFILRIEDTDVARSTQEAVDAILEGMRWLGLDWDEGPFYQTKRMARYKAVIAQMLEAGQAYYCYTTPEELDAMREAQRQRGEKPRYDGRWRPEPGKTLPPVPEGINPVVRFRNPTTGVVTWNDAVKGQIEFANNELDDLVIARADGTPTYNFCVVVDDWDMGITHVIRGDDHVNNTGRQINILEALGAPVPTYAHLSMILGDDGQKLSKRHGAVSVMQYDEGGYLPEAIVNYLARLGWSHGDDEIFSREQFTEWFDLDHITPSAAQFNTDKLNWLNAHYIKQASDRSLAEETAKRLARSRGIDIPPQSLEKVVALYKDRVANLNDLADAAMLYFAPPDIPQELIALHLTETVGKALAGMLKKMETIAWERPELNRLVKDTMAEHGLKMPQIAIPLRILLFGITQTPSIDAVLEVLGRNQVMQRIGKHI